MIKNFSSEDPSHLNPALQKDLVIAVAGASGYIGGQLIPKLLERFPSAQIIALSRSQQRAEDPRVTWKACDLFSVESIEDSLPPQVDLAYYLVHSMGPTANLDQGHFADYDLLLADNFVRALKEKGLRQLIYLGGLIPEISSLSPHLESRLEVEETFLGSSLPTIIFRAGLILGEGGSSFQILLKLVNRLPIMICPAWTKTMTTPVDLSTVLNALAVVALEEAHNGKIYDLAGCKPLTYLDMMRATAKRLGKKKIFFSVPYFSPKLSRFWVSVVTNTPRALVYPLIESLRHEMIARESHLFSFATANRDYINLIKEEQIRTRSARRLLKFQTKRNTVRSVQRLPLPRGKDALWARDQYLIWLPRFLSPIIKVHTENDGICLCFVSRYIVFLRLVPDQKQSQKGWQQLAISEGFLVADKNQGRLEFRTVLGGRFLLTAIHDYMPSLPWYVYVLTQARLHLLVMRAFSKYLARM